MKLLDKIYLYFRKMYIYFHFYIIYFYNSKFVLFIKQIINQDFFLQFYYKMFNVKPFMLSFKYQTLLYMYKIKNLIKDFQPSHVYNTRLKYNNNLNVPLNKTNLVIKVLLLMVFYYYAIITLIFFLLLILISIKIMYLVYFLYCFV
jgi:hypothetical protein